MGKVSNCYVYAHFRLDINKPFYIGIGSKPKYKRAFETKKRNNLWGKIFNKTECDSRVIFDNLTWSEACEIEISLISHLGRIDNNTGILTNLTDGGEGAIGVIFTDERKKKISNSLTGKKLSYERVKKCKLRRHSAETIEKIRKNKTGLKASEATKAKMRVTNMNGINAAAKKISKIVINTQAGIYYESVREAAMSINITHGYLSGMLLGRYRNRTNLAFA